MENKARHKVGDKVRIKSSKWYKENMDSYGVVSKRGECEFLPEMTDLCGTEQEIGKVDEYVENGKTYFFYYLIGERFCWSDMMFEDKNTKEINNSVSDIIERLVNGEINKDEAIKLINSKSEYKEEQNNKTLIDKSIDALVEYFMIDYLQNFNYNKIYEIMTQLKWKHLGQPVTIESIKRCIKSCLKCCILDLKDNYEIDKFYIASCSTGGFNATLYIDSESETLEGTVRFIPFEEEINISIHHNNVKFLGIKEID